MATYTCPVCGEAIRGDAMKRCPGCSWDLSQDIHYARFLGEPGEALKAAHEERLRYAKSAWESRIAIEGLKTQVSGILQRLEERDAALKETLRSHEEDSKALRTMLEGLVLKTRSFDFKGAEAKQAAMQGQIARIEAADKEARSMIDGLQARDKDVRSSIERLVEQNRGIIDTLDEMKRRMGQMSGGQDPHMIVEPVKPLIVKPVKPRLQKPHSAPGVEMVLVEGGNFPMRDSFRSNVDERVARHMSVASFSISKYVVTQGLYFMVMGENPSYFTNAADSEKRPVEQVSWYDAVEFCNRLSERQGLAKAYLINGRSPSTGYPIVSADVTVDTTKPGYRLPTEMEWEYAAYGGRLSKAYEYSGSKDVGAVAWYDRNAGGTTHAVGTKAPNELGLYDMSGNVWEWCWDAHHSYPIDGQRDTVKSSNGSFRIRRGGSWRDDARDCRIAIRNNLMPMIRYNCLGFRLVRRA